MNNIKFNVILVKQMTNSDHRNEARCTSGTGRKFLLTEEHTYGFASWCSDQKLDLLPIAGPGFADNIIHHHIIVLILNCHAKCQ